MTNCVYHVDINRTVCSYMANIGPALIANVFANDVGIHWPCHLESA